MEAEREYKLRAKDQLDALAPVERALREPGLGEAVLKAFRATNLLSPFEQTRLQDLLRGPGSDAFVASVARFAVAPSPTTLGSLAALLKPHGCDKWTIVTYLPFLWRPDVHLYLKPESTKDFAARVGHPFAEQYTPRMDAAVYACLLDLANRTSNEIKGLAPIDRIDIQSFIWVVGRGESYTA